MSVQLLQRTSCPHCWTVFAPEDVLWVSSHDALRGDDRLGSDALWRFLPSRFTVQGEAIDPQGLPCTDLACPKCHLSIPRAALEMEPYFVSVLGTPSSGKTFFLTAMTWELGRNLPGVFAVSYTNADPGTNLTLTSYEEKLFMNPEGHNLLTLRVLVEKTQATQKGHFDVVNYGTQTVIYPRPFMYALKPSSSHANVGEAGRISRLLCLYDIAGEHCLPGGESSFGVAATRHMASSHLLMFVFDPLQDTRFRDKALGTDHRDLAATDKTYRQETVLHEAVARIRRYTGLAQTAKHDKPLVVVVSKSDAWAHLVDSDIIAEPWIRGRQHSGLHVSRVETTSLALRHLLLKYCPEIVHVAEDFADPIYVPVSALGVQPVLHPTLGEPAVKPATIKPRWVTVPLLAGSREGLSSLIFRLRAKEETAVPSRSITPAPRTRPSRNS